MHKKASYIYSLPFHYAHTFFTKIAVVTDTTAITATNGVAAMATILIIPITVFI